ncbi:MAG: hypothetical protein HC936_11345 [Leptolyngbyaceae cyanobacterium SU_3_3]|nr:hypothetical protein [Leptolyngbyaceae cyanobacterium SU_3_3]
MDHMEFQQEILALLNKARTIVGQVIADFDNQRMQRKYENLRNGISEHIENTTRLELRLAIVAPTNAGKSTILNAIAGQEYLPSRGTAMTAIPTEVVFDPKIDTPTLILPINLKIELTARN